MDADPVTLSSLLNEHPEWAELPIVVYRQDGEYDFVGAAAAVYVGEFEEESVLVFAPN